MHVKDSKKNNLRAYFSSHMWPLLKVINYIQGTMWIGIKDKYQCLRVQIIREFELTQTNSSSLGWIIYLFESKPNRLKPFIYKLSHGFRFIDTIKIESNRTDQNQ